MLSDTEFMRAHGMSPLQAQFLKSSNTDNVSVDHPETISALQVTDFFNSLTTTLTSNRMLLKTSFKRPFLTTAKQNAGRLKGAKKKVLKSVDVSYA